MRKGEKTIVDYIENYDWISEYVSGSDATVYIKLDEHQIAIQ